VNAVDLGSTAADVMSAHHGQLDPLMRTLWCCRIGHRWTLNIAHMQGLHSCTCWTREA